MIISDPVREHVLVVSVDDDVNRIVLIIRLLQVLDESVVRLHARLLSLLLVEVDNVSLHQLCKVFHLFLAIHVVLLLLPIHLFLLLQLLIIVHLGLLLYFNHDIF